MTENDKMTIAREAAEAALGDGAIPDDDLGQVIAFLALQEYQAVDQSAATPAEESPQERK